MPGEVWERIDSVLGRTTGVTAVGNAWTLLTVLNPNTYRKGVLVGNDMAGTTTDALYVYLQNAGNAVTPTASVNESQFTILNQQSMLIKVGVSVGVWVQNNSGGAGTSPVSCLEVQ